MTYIALGRLCLKSVEVQRQHNDGGQAYVPRCSAHQVLMDSMRNAGYDGPRRLRKIIGSIATKH